MTTQGSRSAFDNQKVDDKNRHLLDKFDFTDMEDIIRATTTIEELRLGDIIDAQDNLFNWYLAIVIDENSPTNKQIHFLPYQRSNRDETFTNEDQARIAPAFQHSDVTSDIQ